MLSRRAMMNDEVVSANGKDLLLQKCKGSYLHGMKVYGRTTQQTTTGAQLFDKDSAVAISGTNIEWLETGFRVSGAARRGGCECVLPVKPQAKYYFSVGIKNNSSNANATANAGPRAFIYLCADKESPGNLYNATDKNVKDSIISTGDCEYVRFVFAYNWIIGDPLDDESGDATFDEITLSLSDNLTWEPYTGGIPSPNPAYPQELVSAGDKGSIETAVAGKNLFDVERFVSINNLSTIYVDNGDLVLTQGDGREWRRISDYIRLEKGKTYTFLCDTECTFNVRYILNNITYVVYVSGKNARKHTFVSNYAGFVKVKVDQLNAVYPVVFHNSMLCEGDSDVYEPYRPIQTLTHSTPNALPGIPVSSGGNYTDETGQQWIADYRDWERGVDVQKVWKGVFDGSSDEEWSVYDNPTYFGFYLMNALPINADRRNGYCNQFRVDAIGTEIDNGLWIGASGNKYIYVIRNSFYDDTLEDKGLASWKAHLAEQPLVVMTYLDIPIETPIPPEELAAYRELHTNTPTTTITNDEDCWMEVGYRRIRG